MNSPAVSESPDRRRHTRTALKLPVTVMLDDRPVPGDLVDISPGGLLFSCRAEIEIKDNVKVQLNVMPDRRCVGVGAVVRAAGGRGFGVQFTQVNEDMQTFVQDLTALRDELQAEFLQNVVSPMVVVRGD